MSLQSLQQSLAELFSPLDWSLAEFVAELSGQDTDGLLLAVLALSAATAAQHACVDLRLLAGTAVSLSLHNSEQCSEPPQDPGLLYPELADWLKQLEACPIIGQPGSPHPLILSDTRLYLARYWHYEAALAEWVHQRQAEPELERSELRARFDSLFGVAQPESDGPDWQRVAAVSALASRFCIISGGPGTGKTTTVAKILALLLEQTPTLRIALAAPTGKAAARLKTAIQASSESLALPPMIQQQLAALPASTLHRLLGARWAAVEFRHHQNQPLDYDLILVDEASMIDLALMVKLLWAIPPHARLILLGDPDQLASVEAGCVLGDLCALARAEAFSPPRLKLLSELAPARPGSYLSALQPLDDLLVELKVSWRFGAESGIGQLARAIQAGQTQAAEAILQEPGFAEVRRQDLPGSQDWMMALGEQVCQGFAAYLQAANPQLALKAWEEFIVLCALRQGPLGVEGLNQMIEYLLTRQGYLQLSRDGWYHRRPVMITSNDESLGLYNGDIGVCWQDETGLRVWFQAEDGLRGISPLRLRECETAWAMTVHKSQGSEFRHLLLILPERDSPILTRELIYTGLTRARQSALFWASAERLQQAIERPIRRQSGLSTLLARNTSSLSSEAM